MALRDAILGRSRSLHLDALNSVKPFSEKIKILQENNIPTEGPCLLVMNHYDRPRFDAWWIGLGISAVVPVEIHWMMTNAWTHVGALNPVTQWLFPRLARVYRFTTTPPMPPKPKDVENRAQAVRHVLRAAREPGAIIAITPEGRDHPGGILGSPPPGVGRFIHQITKHCQPIIPIGVYDDVDHFYINFGSPYKLVIPAELTPVERDHHVTQQVMQSIAVLLPTRLRGNYDPI
jgi:1-acyl-sn-glycerol-3-phosphate acyltransferase